MKFVGFVLVTALIYMSIHLRSIILAIFSLVNLMMSIPIALCIYRLVLQVDYFSSLHFSAILIILGIGADDIFVFHDQWKSTFQIRALNDDPVRRLSMTFRLASSAMLVTSLTSSIAFFACYFSAIMPLRSFGLFAGLLVPIDFLLTIFVQPVLYYVYETTFLSKKKAEGQEEGPNSDEGRLAVSGAVNDEQAIDSRNASDYIP